MGTKLSARVTMVFSFVVAGIFFPSEHQAKSGSK